MKSASTLKEFSNQEKQFLTGYLMAYAWDVTKHFRMVEQQASPNLILHYAVPDSDSPLATVQLDSLGDLALALRDDFKAHLTTLNVPIRSAAVAVQFLGGQALLGIVDRNKLNLSQVKDPGESMELSVYLPESEPGTSPEDIGE
jgi:hypothetical protein